MRKQLASVWQSEITLVVVHLGKLGAEEQCPNACL